MPETYIWKQGAHASLPAQVVGERLERIRLEHNGRMTPGDVVDDARPESSPLHSAFEWNDEAAAESYRRGQASYLIRSIAVSFQGDAEQPKTLRAFVSILEDSESHYTSTVAALSSPELRARVLKKAWDELQAWRRKYDDLTELAAVFAEIDRGATPTIALAG